MKDNPFIINQAQTTNVALNRFYGKIYSYVACGLALSALVSYLSVTVFLELTLRVLFSSSFVVWGIMLAELALVFVASAAAAKNSPKALPLFLAYSVLNGFTMTFILLAYTGETIFLAFVSTVLMFAVMAVIGMKTKKNLSGMGQAMLAALIGVIVASMINVFMQSSTMGWMISIVSVVIFAGLIAYDNQRIRHVFEATNGDVHQGWAVSMALTLYLDFINLFINILRLTGRRD